MSRQEQNREDLLLEATALVERIELALPTQAEPIVAGRRRDGCWSIYFGSDPAWHFNRNNEVRRAYVEGRLLKAERGCLAALTRKRTESEVALIRQEISPQEQARLLSDLRTRLGQLQAAIGGGLARPLRQAPLDAPVLEKLAEWLAALPPVLAAASSPRVG